jgi:plasmid stability protein
MAHQTLTLLLPEDTYEQLRQRAEHEQRSIEAEALRAVEAGLDGAPSLPPDLAATLATMALLDDEALWHAARLQLPEAEQVLLATLNDKLQREGLTEAEQRTLADLAARQGRVAAMRADAVALLHRRGHDVSALVARA